MLGAFRSLVGWLKRRGTVRDIPEFPWPRVDEYQPRIISAETQDAILRAIPRDRRGIFLCMALMGLRPGEARALDAADYNDVDGYLDVTKAVKGARLTDPIRGTKGRRGKRLPVDAELAAWIAQHVPLQRRLQAGALFLNPSSGNRWTPTSLRRTWQKACGQVGVTISIYEGTKHSFATDALRRGVQERHIQEFLGHADVRSTRRYARLANQALISVLRPREIGKSEGDLLPACSPRRRGSRKPPKRKRKLVEAAGIEPASAWFPAPASTCVAPCLF